MKVSKLVSACAASAFVLALFDATAAEAGMRRSFSTNSGARMMVAKRQVQPRVQVKKVPVLKKNLAAKKIITKTPVTKKLATKAPAKLVAKNGMPKFVAKNHLKLGKAKIKGLPVFKPVQTTKVLKGRLALPQNIKPKLTLTLAPKKQFQMGMSPFIQKHWKKSFFWVAVAGLGYITVPELYYDRFMGYVNLDDPDYDACVKLLSYAALEEEEFYMVREPMPPTATYRYRATSAPDPKVVAITPQEGGTACALTPFVERKWNQAFVWVQVPEMGNVTVPEDYYDRFHGYVSGEPPNYIGACQVLVEAAAADMMAATTVDVKRTDYN